MRPFIILLLAFSALPAFAHPGEHHGSLMAFLEHVFTEPDHLAMMALALVVGIGAARYTNRRALQRRKSDDPR